jgi:predicted HTH transcriptional regulator
MSSKEEAKERILNWMKEQKKTKHYFNDLCKAVPELSMREAKKIINELVSEGKLRYWTSGSTTMYMLPGVDDVKKEEEGMV